MIGKSLHITWDELACRDGTAYPSSFKLDGRVIELVVMFERIRAIWDSSIIINSAYRTVAYNKSIGGASKSQHLEGKALDLQPPKGITVVDFYNTLKSNYKELGIRGLGKYSTFIHCDIRDSIELVTWRG
jgi:uncharacterized protein YcbK (DUF882 family)